MDLLLFEMLSPDDLLELEPGARLVLDLPRLRMWTSTRIYFPNFGYVAGLLAEGRIRWITPGQSEEEAIPLPEFPVRLVA